MGEKVQINFRVDHSQKEEWEKYIDESGRFSSLSELMRAAVEKEINSDHSEGSVESPAISSDITELKRDIEGIRKDVRWLRKQQQDEVDVSDLAQEVFDVLETLPDPPVSDIPEEVEDTQTFRRKEGAQMVIRPSSESDSRSPQTDQAIADQLRVKPGDVRDAIDHLQDQFLPVVAVEIDGQTHYFKEE